MRSLTWLILLPSYDLGFRLLVVLHVAIGAFIAASMSNAHQRHAAQNWTITIDGVEAPAVITNVGSQGVVIPSAGRHVVELRYRNPLVASGAAISLCALLVVAYLVFRRRHAPLQCAP